METRYISSADLTPRQIEAGLSDGSLRLWRYGSGGQQWYERVDGTLPLIKGVAPTAEEQAELQRLIEAQAAVDAELAEVGAESLEDAIDEASVDRELAAAHARFYAFMRGDLTSEAGDE